MKRKSQPGFFDIAERTAKLTQMGDPLVGLNERINWEAFRPDLGRVHEKERKALQDNLWVDARLCEGIGACGLVDNRPAAHRPPALQGL